MIRPRKQPDICQGTCSLTFRQYSTEDTDFSSVISIHAPAEGATKRGFAEWQNNVYFNPRSRGGSDAVYNFTARCLINFNPRSRGGSDSARSREGATTMISIHAPAKGATLCRVFPPGQEDISIHAPAKGATGIRSAWLFYNAISIRAPAKGATVPTA